MNLKLNSALALALICLYALGVLIGAPVIYVFQLHTTGVPTIAPEGQWIYSIYFLYEYFDHIIVAIWLLLNVPEFKEDSLTWILCGLAFGALAVPLFVAIMIYRREYGTKFRTSFSSLMLALLPYYLFKYVGEYTFNHYDLVKLPPEWRIESTAAGILMVYFATLTFFMNILLTVYILQLLRGKERSWVWGLSTLILGAGPAIIKLVLMIYFRKKPVAREAELA
jgi:hypothetical protein